MSKTKRIFGTADVADALGITPEGVRSAVRHRENDDRRPKWLEDPMPEMINGGHVWDRRAVERMVAKAPTPRVRKKTEKA